MTDETPSSFMFCLWRQARKIVVFVVGSTVLAIGIIMIVAPGPAFVVIPIGLGILGTEFVWARRWLKYAKKRIRDLAQQAAQLTKQSKRSSEETG